MKVFFSSLLRFGANAIKSTKPAKSLATARTPAETGNKDCGCGGGGGSGLGKPFK